MKPSTSKFEARKKQVIAVTPEVAKKDKVRAQRKFAQGLGSPHSHGSHAKERERSRNQVDNSSGNSAPTPEPLLTTRVPTTEQFLDFICYGSMYIYVANYIFQQY